MAELRKRCPGNHEHFPIEGSVRTKDGTISLSSWAGGYPVPLCRAIMTGVINYIHRPDGKQVYVLEDHVAEESYQDGMDAIREEEEQIAEELAEPEEDERRAVPREVQKAVEFAHRQLGHPSRDTLVRMLRISGATGATLHFSEGPWSEDLRTVDEEAGCLAKGATDGVQRDQRAGDHVGRSYFEGIYPLVN